jgi:hypothetical protein
MIALIIGAICTPYPHHSTPLPTTWTIG